MARFLWIICKIDRSVSCPFIMWYIFTGCLDLSFLNFSDDVCSGVLYWWFAGVLKFKC